MLGEGDTRQIHGVQIDGVNGKDDVGVSLVGVCEAVNDRGGIKQAPRPFPLAVRSKSPITERDSPFWPSSVLLVPGDLCRKLPLHYPVCLGARPYPEEPQA